MTTRTAPVPWLTAWDEEMIEQLRPIAGAKRPPTLRMIFFANTFPIAYHYALALRQAGKFPRNYVKPGLWKVGGSGREIFYTNDKRAKLIQKEVTTFNPMWVFVPLTLSTSRIWKSLTGDDDHGENGKREAALPPLSDFLTAAKNTEFDSMWIYAELEDLGEYVKGIVRNTFSCPKVLFAQTSSDKVNLPVFEANDIHPNLLRLFVFGGSLSSYLRRKETRYLPLTLPPPTESSEDDAVRMKTYICGPQEFVEKLGQYHSRLYGAAFSREDNESCPPFFTVYRAYNDMAWLLQHRSSFGDAEEFSQCLRDHHSPEH